nr:GNAT family N-acetyltransferase [Streptococcus gallolyticus]
MHQYQTLETEHLILHPVTLADAEAMFAYVSDEENTHWNFPANKTLEEIKAAIKNIYLKTPLGRYGIILKGTNAFIGTID